MALSTTERERERDRQTERERDRERERVRERDTQRETERESCIRNDSNQAQHSQHSHLLVISTRARVGRVDDVARRAYWPEMRTRAMT